MDFRLGLGTGLGLDNSWLKVIEVLKGDRGDKRSRKVMEGHGRSWKVLEDQGRSRKVNQGH